MDQPQGPQQQLTPEQQKAQETLLIDSATSRLRRMHSFRQPYDPKRAGLYRQYIGQRDAMLFPDGVTKRSNTFVPYPYSNVETVVSRTDDAFFSNWPFFETRGRGAMDDDRADAMQNVLEFMLHQAQIKTHLETLTRGACIYGPAAIKVDWDWDYDVLQGPEPVFAQQIVPKMEMGPQGPQPVMQDGKPVPEIDPQTGQPRTQNMVNPQTGEPIQIGTHLVSKKVPRNRPKFIPIDVYDLLVDPDGAFIAHMNERTLPQMMREAEMNPNLYYPAALQELQAVISREDKPDEIIIRFAELWNTIDNTCTLITCSFDPEAITWKDVRASYRSASYSGFRRRMYGGKAILLWSGLNQFVHKRNPILYTSYSKLPNEIYGLGIIEVISDLSESLNKMVNMVTDNWNLGINRRYAYDVNADIDHAALNQVNLPGGKVAVNGDPTKVLSALPFYTPAAGDYGILELYKGMIEMTSGVSDFYSKGLGSAGGNRTATGIQQVIGESNYRFKMFIRNLEIDIFQPLLEMCASNIQQFCPDQVEYMITDAPPGIPKYGAVPLESIMGNYDFIMAAANYATNKNIRQRQMMSFAQVVAESGYLIERAGLLEMAKVFEVPHPNRFVKTEQQYQQEQQAQAAQQIQMRNDEWKHEADMMILQAMLNTEVKARTAQATPRATGGGTTGRPRKFTQPEGPIKGAGLTSAIKSFAQSMGTNADSMGMSGMGEVPTQGG